MNDLIIPDEYVFHTKSGNEEANYELLKDYWSFSDTEKRKYTYSVKDLVNKYKLKNQSDVLKIAKNSGYLEYRDTKECGKCLLISHVESRQQLSNHKYSLDRDKICHDCRKIEFERYIKSYLEEFKKYIPEKENLDDFLPPTDSLNYLENIFLYCLIKDDKNISDNYISINFWNDFLQLEAKNLEFILKKLFEKRYLYKTNDYSYFETKQNELREKVYKYRQYINDELLEEINNYLRLSFKLKIKIIFADHILTKDEWLEEIFNKIKNHSFSVSDAKEIEKYLEIKRLNETYELVHYTCNYRKVPYELDSALEFELIRMTKNFNLRYIYSIIAYQAKETSAELYKIENGGDSNYRFRKNHVFRHKLSSYLTYLSKRNENPKFDRDLPPDWTHPEVENFVAANIIGNYEHWEIYIPNEILRLWVGDNL